MPRRIEGPPNPWCATRSWAAMEVHDWYAARRPDLLPVEDMVIADVEAAGNKGLDVLVGHVAQSGAAR